jgi:hypothetical protein
MEENAMTSGTTRWVLGHLHGCSIVGSGWALESGNRLLATVLIGLAIFLFFFDEKVARRES